MAQSDEEMINYSSQSNNESDIALHVQISAGIQKFFRNLGATSKFEALEGFHEETPILRIHK
jgi:hypothetical protein